MSTISNRRGARSSNETSASITTHAARPQRRIPARLTAMTSAVAAAITAAHETRVPF